MINSQRRRQRGRERRVRRGTAVHNSSLNQHGTRQNNMARMNPYTAKTKNTARSRKAPTRATSEQRHSPYEQTSRGYQQQRQQRFKNSRNSRNNRAAAPSSPTGPSGGPIGGPSSRIGFIDSPPNSKGINIISSGASALERNHFRNQFSSKMHSESSIAIHP